MKLNLGGSEKFEGGSGSKELVGYINIDARHLPGDKVDMIADVRSLPIKSGIVDEIRASHVIEHLNSNEVQDVVKHWASLLRESGLLRIYCPNAWKLAEDWLGGRIDVEKFSRQLFGAQTYDLNLHRMAVDQKRLDDWVVSAGLKIVGRDPRPNAYRYDMGVQAVK